MRKVLCGTVCVLWAASGILLAQDAKGGKDSPLEKIKTLRASLLVKVPVMNDLFDNEHNGINAAANAVLKQYQDATAAVNKQIEAEDAKPADSRDKAAADALRAKLARIQTLWSDRQTAGPAWNQKFYALSLTRQNLGVVVADVASLDQSWLRADCDRGLFVAVLTELNKRVDEVKEQVSALIAEWSKRSDDDMRAMQE